MARLTYNDYDDFSHSHFNNPDIVQSHIHATDLKPGMSFRTLPGVLYFVISVHHLDLRTIASTMIIITGDENERTFRISNVTFDIDRILFPDWTRIHESN